MSDGTVISTDAAGTVKWFSDAFVSNESTRVRVAERRVRLLSSDSAVIDFALILEKAGAEAGTTTVCYVCVRRAGEWKVAALRFTPRPSTSRPGEVRYY